MYNHQRKSPRTKRSLLLLYFWPLFFVVDVVVSLGLLSKKAKRGPITKTNSLVGTLQNCYNPQSLLTNVGVYLNSETDPQGTLSSLVLVRLSKQLIAIENASHPGPAEDDDSIDNNWLNSCLRDDDVILRKSLKNVINTFVSAKWMKGKSLEAAVEGTKAASVISRLLLPHVVPVETWTPLLKKWQQVIEEEEVIISDLEPHHLSGLKWSVDCFYLHNDEWALPHTVQEAYDSMNLPFYIRPCFFHNFPNEDFTVSNLMKQVNFQVDNIRTTSTNCIVKERRQTAWQGDDTVMPFEYSGKCMKRMAWSPLVRDIRDILHERTGHYYDGCLVNLYWNGESGMRYHIDPDQGTLWGYETAVVSMGTTRRFAFRTIPSKNSEDSKPHVFVLMSGDVTEMFNDCQERFQHCVKTSENRLEKTPRVSLVFKKAFYRHFH